MPCTSSTPSKPTMISPSTGPENYTAASPLTGTTIKNTLTSPCQDTSNELSPNSTPRATCPSQMDRTNLRLKQTPKPYPRVHGPTLDKHGTTKIQAVSGTFLYYSRACDPCILPALNEIAANKPPQRPKRLPEPICSWITSTHTPTSSSATMQAT
jgi:hypothetical protein